ncbi:hypothetical protein CAPTEDRAFT_229121 [Capitella teleta]|uniref:Ribosomal RNA large subunit methyltransferase K/L-like methyltransferase domain-containing protein n=1 Tax=Capitella teleta TaxID=283909 RepID=R7TMW6_CAPTE|nr:hypothetical protein CAPTEDRAFT_229121 [Capitella teleta]|eukprot:ELT94984.1 hypothetical protein CAPTEDRAFT_229121 [Capitella teleta]
MATSTDGAMCENQMEQKDDLEEYCEIEASIVAGFEPLAEEEIMEKLGVTSTHERGRVNFRMKICDARKALKLCSIDNLMVVMNHYRDFPFSKDCDTAIQQIRDLVPGVDWKTGLKVWKQFDDFPHPVLPVAYPANLPKENPTEEDKKTLLPKFRATCYRSHGKHSFQSPQAAAAFGGVINDYFAWNVDLENHNINAVLIVEGSNMYAAIELTKTSLHKRHIVKFGYTTLRGTIAYNMLRMCKIKPGDVVCDPMCGSGVLPIEAAVNYPDAQHLCGDIYEFCAPSTKMNIDAVNKKRKLENQGMIPLDAFTWDASNLPLPDKSVDVFVTDLPFGKRSGSKMRNWVLYPKVLKELARVSRPITGRACFLTQDTRCFLKTLHNLPGLWKRTRTIGISIGGLAASVYVLHRTTLAHDDPSVKPPPAKKSRNDETLEAKEAESTS